MSKGHLIRRIKCIAIGLPADWLVALWGEELPIQPCTVHKHRILLGHAPKHMHDVVTEDCRDMICANDVVKIETRRKAFLRK